MVHAVGQFKGEHFMKTRLLLFALVLVMLGSTSAVVFGADIDLGGQTIGIAYYKNFYGVTPLGDRNDFNWEEPDARLAAHIAEVEERFNCKIEFVDSVGGDALERISAEILSGHPTFHFIHTNNPINLAIGGYIHRVGDFLDEDYYNSLPSMFRTTEGMMVNGQVYAIEPQNYTIEAIMLFWNKDLFEREGLPNLYELYENGEWTWEKFEEIAVALSKDIDGDGVIDQWGFGTHNDNFANFILTNNTQLVKEVDGKVVVAFDEPAVVETIEFLRRLYERNGFGLNRGGGLRDGTVGMTMDIVQTFSNKKGAMGGDEYGIVPLPKGPNATEHVAPIWNRWMGVVPVTVPNPEEVIEVINALYKLTEPYMDVTLEEWEQNYWYDTVASQVYDLESLENWMWSSENAKILEHKSIGNFKNEIKSLIYEGGSIAAKLAEIKPVAQAELDEIYNQQ